MASVFKRGGKANRGGSYYVSWFDHTGQRQSKSARTTDKAAAERIAAKLEAEAALRRDGVIDPIADSILVESQRPVESHLDNYRAKFIAANRSDQYVRETIGYIRSICQRKEFGTVGDITADGVNHFASELKGQGKSSRTIQAYLTAMKGFTKWLVANGKLPRDPLTSVRKPNPKADRRRERRILLPEEWQWLRSVTTTGPDRYGTSGQERVLLYATAVQTGLRSNELRSLTRGRLFLDADQPFITCKAGSTKNKKEARQYIKPKLAVKLQIYIATKAPKTRVFSMPHEANVVEMIRADLAEARAAWLKAARHNPEEYVRREQSDFLMAVNHEGEVFDFHSLRHTCGAWLAMSGAHPKEVQTIMRHSSITLTMDTYGHLFPGQEAAAAARFPDMFADAPEPMRATGTDEVISTDTPKLAQRQAQQSGRETVQNSAIPCEMQAVGDDAGREVKSIEIADVYANMRTDASPCEEAGPLGFEPRLTDPESVVLPLH